MKCDRADIKYIDHFDLLHRCGISYREFNIGSRLIIGKCLDLMQKVGFSDNQLAVNAMRIAVGRPCRNDYRIGFFVKDLQLNACKRLILAVDLNDLNLGYLFCAFPLSRLPL